MCVDLLHDDGSQNGRSNLIWGLKVLDEEHLVDLFDPDAVMEVILK